VLLADWPLRPWVLAALLAFAGLLIHLLVNGQFGLFSTAKPDPLRSAATALVFFGSLSAAFSIAPGRLRASGLFALGAGLVMAGLAWHLARVQEPYSGAPFAFFAGIFATVLALPLFQAGFHRTRLATDYKITHFHVWTDAISAGGALAFVGLSWLLLFLLDQLLGLVGIPLIEMAMEQDWFGWVWSGGAFGAALGVLRNNLKIIGSLQNVVLIVLSLLAIPLALGLVVFVVALLASGGKALWDATDAATPVLLACAVGCFIFTNSIVREDDDALSGNRVMRIAAMVLAGGILPLALFAAVSMGIRIDQHGLSPERLWALVTVIVAVAYGLAYWVGLARGRKLGWAPMLRQANLHLAAATCVLALVLALPLIDFGGISARNQIARLESGRVSAEQFDFTALRWDFGPGGRRALARLAAGEGEVADLAKAAQAQTERVWDWQRDQVQQGFTGELRVQPENPELEVLVRSYLATSPWQCAPSCVALDLGLDVEGRQAVALVQGFGYNRLVFDKAGAVVAPEVGPAASTNPAEPVIELREETTRFVYVNGRRIDTPVD
jgi:hypothetical protein